MVEMIELSGRYDEIYYSLWPIPLNWPKDIGGSAYLNEKVKLQRQATFLCCLTIPLISARRQVRLLCAWTLKFKCPLIIGEIGRSHPSLLGEVLISGPGMQLSGAVSTYIVKTRGI